MESPAHRADDALLLLAEGLAIFEINTIVVGQADYDLNGLGNASIAANVDGLSLWKMMT